MAIKVSNQITFTEHKKIVKIKEWYLVTSKDSGVTNETDGWSTDIPTMNSIDKYLWNYEETIYSLGSSEITYPVIIGVYGENGESGASLQIKYISSKTTPIITDNNVSAWSDNVPSQVDGEKIYMIQKLSTDINWSTPIQISGNDGKNGSANIEINNDGYWVINGEITDVKAEGSDGETPTIEIIDGYWYINGENSDIKAQGEAGKDGSDIEYVYYRNNTGSTPTTPSYDSNSQLTTGWTASPQGINETNKYEFVSIRTKPAGSTNWNTFSTPVVWSKWGEKGQDGDGVEYKYYLKNDSTVPTYSADDENWTDDPTGVSSNNQYEYVIQIKTVNGVTKPAETASLWAKYGVDGKGISEIQNYYSTTTSADETPSSWSINFPELTPENKYLWNFEYILYTDGTFTTTTPAIIGAYGDSGTDAVDFQIYSVDGFEFSDVIESIELKTAAFKGGKVIDDDVTYQWKWWDKTSTNEDKYVDIPDETSSSLIITLDKLYALAEIKCEMTYEGKTYIDHVSLTEKTDIYTSVVKFFDGSNMFTANNQYLVAYIDLYKNNHRIETIATEMYYSGISTIDSTGVITSVVSGEFEDGARLYFICENNNGLYYAVLCEYKNGQWKKVDYKTEYLYRNNVYIDSDPYTNIIVISKESVNKSKNIDFTIYKDDVIVSSTYTMVIDINDPIISNNSPANPANNQLWLDTSVSPSILKIYSQDENKWLECSSQVGKSVYTSQPSKYSIGDLWILESQFDEYGQGSMLKANQSSNEFNIDHWGYADTDMPQIKDITQYFSFNQESGLKIGRRDESFYVRIDSDEMGFYDNSNPTNPNALVVKIGNDSAEIKNAVLDGESGTKIKNDITFEQQINIFQKDTTNGFIWKLEEDGSLSLAISTS